MTTINYRERKQAGTVVVARHNDAHVLILRQFSPDTGRELAPEQIGISIEAVQQRRAEMLDQLAQLDELLSDLRATTRTLGEIIAEAAGRQKE